MRLRQFYPLLGQGWSKLARKTEVMPLSTMGRTLLSTSGKVKPAAHLLVGDRDKAEPTASPGGRPQHIPPELSDAALGRGETACIWKVQAVQELLPVRALGI